MHEPGPVLQGAKLGRGPVRPEPDLVAPLLVVLAADGLVLKVDSVSGIES